MNVKINERKMNGPNRGYSPDLALEHGKPLGKVRDMPHCRHNPDFSTKIKVAQSKNMGKTP